MRLSPFSILLLAPLFLGACLSERPEDALEPNDRPEQATPLTPGHALQARVNEGNLDVFAIEVAAQQSLRFELRHLAFDCCAGFELTDPDGRVLLRTPRGCPLITRPEVRDATVEFVAATHRNDFEIRVEPTRAGRYCLTLDEGSTADGFGPYSWDYELTVHLR